MTFVTLLIILTSAVVLSVEKIPNVTYFEQCAKKPLCLMSLNQFMRLQHFTSNGVIGRPYCPVLERVFYNYETVQVSGFKPNSSWAGVLFSDMHGVALSPLFIPHGELSCTEFLINQSDDGQGISLGMRHLQRNSVDFSFNFNASGWIKYKERYGCEKNSLQVDNTRIVKTDYENYIFIYGCEEPLKEISAEAIHSYGYLVLVKSDQEIKEEIQWMIEGVLNNLVDMLTYKPLENVTTMTEERKAQCSMDDQVDMKPLCVSKKLKIMENEFEESAKNYLFKNVYLGISSVSNSSATTKRNSRRLLFASCIILLTF